MNLTLRYKVNGAIIVTFLLIAVIFTAIQLPFQHHRLQTATHNIELLLQTLVERDREQLANEIFDSRLNAIKIRLKQMRKVEGILAIGVFDTYGKLLIEEGSFFIDQKMDLQDVKKSHPYYRIQKKRWQDQAGMLFSKEIDFLGERLGFIQIFYSLANLAHDQRVSFLIFGSLLGSIFLVMLIVLNLILSKAILKPIMRLRDATQVVTQGNRGEENHTPYKDELDILAWSFRKMQDSLQEKFQALQIEVSVRKRAEEALRESEEKFSKAFYLSPDSISITSIETGEFADVNQGFRDIFGYERDELIGNSTVNLGIWKHASDRNKMVEMLKNDGCIRNFIAEGKTKSGSTFLGEISSQVIDINKEKYLLTIVRDITQREQQKAELLRLRNYLRNIIDSMPSVIVGVDCDGRVTQWNAAAEQTTKITADDAHGKTLSDVFPQMALEMEKITASIQARAAKHQKKKPRLLENGTRYEDVTIYPLISNGVEGAVIRIDDVTEQVRLEEMMVQSEKMLSVGGLAAGMAHEINNPLAGMMQTAEVMGERLTNIGMPANRRAAKESGISMEGIRTFMEKRGILRMIAAINESGHRVATIVDNMLNFARKNEAQSAHHDMADLLNRTLELAASDYDLKKHYDFKLIEIVKEYEDKVPRVPCEGAKIQQVLLNILRNGAQAMQTTETRKPRFIIRTRFEKERKMVCMEIEDNGPGMDDETRKRIFEPFFTTKPVGVGTGLGLSVSYFIITENYNGEMSVESTPGEGSNLIIKLPLGKNT